MSKAVSKKLFILFLVCSLALPLFFILPQTQATTTGITKVQGPITASGRSTSVTITLTSTPIVGNTLTLLVGTVSGWLNTLSTVAQTGVEWDMIINASSGSSTQHIIIYVGTVTGPTPSTTVNLTFTNNSGESPSYRYIINEYSGLMATDQVDQTTSYTATVTTNGFTGETGILSQANELSLGGIFAYTGGDADLTFSSPTNDYNLTNYGIVVGGRTGYIAALEKITYLSYATSCNATCANSATILGVLVTLKGLPTTYSYSFNGVYDETTGNYIGACNVTANFDDGTAPYSFSVSGSETIYASNSQPLYFEYNIHPYANTTDTTINRQYWLEPDETSGSYNIFGNEIGLVHIIFQIRALGGVGLSSYLDVQRIINGTYQTVEKRQVDANGIATMSLQPYTVYRLIAVSQNSSYTFGNINTYTTAITLTLSALSFPNDVLMQYKYLRIWASRPSSTEIQINYEDTNLQTLSVSYQIAFANGTVAYSAIHTGENSFIDVWSAADPDTTYYLTANVSQSTFGSSTFAQVLLRDGASTSPIDLSFLGDWPIDPTQIFWAFIVFIVFGVGSVLNAYIGGFAGVATAAIFVWLGWLVIPSGAIVAAFCVVCMVGIVYWKRRS